MTVDSSCRLALDIGVTGVARTWSRAMTSEGSVAACVGHIESVLGGQVAGVGRQHLVGRGDRGLGGVGDKPLPALHGRFRDPPARISRRPPEDRTQLCLARRTVEVAFSQAIRDEGPQSLRSEHADRPRACLLAQVLEGPQEAFHSLRQASITSVSPNRLSIAEEDPSLKFGISLIVPGRAPALVDAVVSEGGHNVLARPPLQERGLELGAAIEPGLVDEVQGRGSRR